MAAPNLYNRLPARLGGRLASSGGYPLATTGGKVPALGYRPPTITGGGGGVTIYPLGPLGGVSIGGGEGGGGIQLPGLSNLSFNIGGSKPRLVPGTRTQNLISRARAMQAVAPAAAPPVQAPAQILPSRGPGKPPAAYPNYRVINVPAEAYTPSAATSAVTTPTLTPIMGQAPAAAAVPAATTGMPGLANLMQATGLVQAATALTKLLSGQSLSGPEFGALAGAALGFFIDDPQLGAKIGLGVGEVMNFLNTASKSMTGQTVDQWLSSGAKGIWNRLFGTSPTSPAATPAIPTAPAGQPSPYGSVGLPLEYNFNPQPYTKSFPPAATIFPEPQPTPATTPVNPLTVNPPPQPGNLPVVQPSPGPIPTGNLGNLIGQQGGNIPPTSLNNPLNTQPGGTPNCPTCVTGIQNDCPPEVEELVNQMANCPPQTLQKLLDRVQINPNPGGQPTMTVIEPVCLCCDSQGDLAAYTKSGGITGKCVQVLGATVSDVQKQ